MGQSIVVPINIVICHQHVLTLSRFYQQVACTNWKRVMFVLNQKKLHLDLLSLPKDFIHETDKITLLSSFPRAEIKVSLYSDIDQIAPSCRLR